MCERITLIFSVLPAISALYQEGYELSLAIDVTAHYAGSFETLRSFVSSIIAGSYLIKNLLSFTHCAVGNRDSDAGVHLAGEMGDTLHY